jgi:hypothetical protein
VDPPSLPPSPVSGGRAASGEDPASSPVAEGLAESTPASGPPPWAEASRGLDGEASIGVARAGEGLASADGLAPLPPDLGGLGGGASP